MSMSQTETNYQQKERKKELNKRAYTEHTPYPVRVYRPLKEILLQEANRLDVSMHSLMIKAIEMAYAPALEALSKSVNIHFAEVVSLIRAGYKMEEVMKELKIDTKVFLRGLSVEQNKELTAVVRRKEYKN